MSEETVVVFTSKSVDRILKEGGTSSWRVDRSHARQCVFAVCTRNANSDWVEGSEPHHAAFLVGKVREVVPSSDPGCEDRYLIQFSEYALLNVPDVWKGERNPVKYEAIENLGIDPQSLKWEPMPKPAPAEPNSAAREVSFPGVGPLTMAQAKKGLAIAFGVSPEAVEITIHG